MTVFLFAEGGSGSIDEEANTPYRPRYFGAGFIAFLVVAAVPTFALAMHGPEVHWGGPQS